MTDGSDALVGLRFEVSGGLSRMTGRIVGKVGVLYLVQRQGAEHLELLTLDDLRPAKFYAEPPAEAAPADEKTGTAAASQPSSSPSRKRLADQIRKRLGAG